MDFDDEAAPADGRVIGGEVDHINAKSFLLTTSAKSGLNLYDHLSRVLMKILDEKPNDVVDVFEDISREVKKSKFEPEGDTIREKPEKSPETILAEMQQRLFLKGDGLDAAESEATDEDAESPLPNLMELCFYFEQAGVGLNREEAVRIWLALGKLIETQPVGQVRFWGKFFGTERNYIVAEAEYRGEGEADEEEEREMEEANEDTERERDDEEDEVEVAVDNIPKSNFKPPAEPPKEEKGTGANKKTYFVCNEPGDVWTKLPPVTPTQIIIARKIKKFFTGRLDAQVISYPPFPGTEANYLRAQVARISAGTQITPLGYYQFDEEEEEEAEEGAVRDNFVVNPEFEPIPVKDLVDPSLANWVHHVLHILPQGRTTWWNPGVKNDREPEDNDEEEEEREEPEEVEPEVGPPLLTPLSEDAEVGRMAPWMTRISSKMIPQYAIAVVHSCLWPGAHAFSNGRRSENIYIGWGHKYSPTNLNPLLPPPPQAEFPTGPEVTEADDPTPDEEAELKVKEPEKGDDDAEEENEEAEDAVDEEEDDD